MILAGLRILGRIIGVVLLTIYLVASRSLVVIAALYLTLYFALGSRPVKDAIQQAVSDAVPGTIGSCVLQWGPLPWHVRLAEARIIGSRGEEIIRVRGVEATIDLGRTLDDLFAWMGRSDELPFRISLERVELLEPWSRIEVRDDGWVGIEKALAAPPDPNAPPSPETPGFELVADVVRILDGAGRVDVPGFYVSASGLDTVTNYRMQVRGQFSMEFDVPRVVVPEGELVFTGFSHMPDPLYVSARDLQVEDFAWRGLGFSWRDAHGVLGDHAHARFRSSGGLNAQPSPATWHGEGVLELDGDAPELPLLTADLVRGPVTFAIGGFGDVEQFHAGWSVAGDELAIGNLLYRDVAARGRFEPRGVPAIRDRHAIFLDHADARLGAGRIALDALSWDARTDDSAFDERRDLSFAVRAEDADVISALIALFGPEIPHLPPAAWTGGAVVSLHPRPEVQGETMTVELTEARATWETPPLPGLGREWVVAGHAEREAGVTSLWRDGDARGLGPFDMVDLRGVVIDSGPNRARLAGSIDMLSGAIELEPYARIGDLNPTARALGVGDLGGRLVVKAAYARGTVFDPIVRGTLNWTDARVGPHALKRVQGGITLVDGELSLVDAASKSAVADFAASASLRLYGPGFVPDPDLPFRVDARRLQGLLASAIGLELGPEARISIDSGQVTGRLLDPLGSLQGSGRVIITNARIADERGVRMSARVNVAQVPKQGTIIALDDVEVTFESGAVWRGRLRLKRPPQPEASIALSGNLVIGDTSLANLQTVAQALPELSAIARGHLTLAGTVARPVVIGTLEIEDAIIGRLVLGDALLSVTTSDNTVEVSAFDKDLFGGFSLQRAALVLDGFSVRRFEATILARDKKLGDLVPDLDDAAVSVFGSAGVEVALDVPTGLTSFRVTAGPRQVTVEVSDRGVRWTNESALLLVSDGRRFRVHPLTLAPVDAASEATPPKLDVCGTIDAERLDLQLAGAVDLAIIPGLPDVFSVAQGKVEITSDAVANRSIGDNTCLQNADALMHLGGTAAAPVAVGSLRMNNLILVPRGSGREVRLRNGSTVELREGKRAGVQRLVLGADGTSFEGDLDEGSFGLRGVVVFEDLRPNAIDLRLSGADLFIQSAGEFAFTASPNAGLFGHDLDTANPKLAIRGDLTLSEGRFSKSFDTLARAVGGAFGVKSDAYTTSLLDDVPWLGTAALDINVVASDFQIQTALPLARTDLPARLDLTLRGTIADPKLYRRIDLLPGGTLTYLVFERTFSVSQGAVDFDGDPERPLVDVTAQTLITYLQRAQTALQEEDEKEVAVTLRMTGRVPDLKIELSSDDPTLDQADIQSLLITGKPRGDLDRAQESRVVSADLANVINTVLSAPFVRTASVGVDQRGGLEYRVGTCFAPNLCFDTTTVSDDTETTLRAKFSLSIGDDVVCEGTLKRSDTGATTSQETYEARCRYRIPLD